MGEGYWAWHFPCFSAPREKLWRIEPNLDPECLGFPGAGGRESGLGGWPGRGLYLLPSAGVRRGTSSANP